jgi:hypothetical protein
MWTSYLIAAVAISTSMLLWTVVQRAWARVVDPADPEPDVLRRRISCGSCGCAKPCDGPDSENDERGRVSLEHGTGAQ